MTWLCGWCGTGLESGGKSGGRVRLGCSHPFLDCRGVLLVVCFSGFFDSLRSAGWINIVGRLSGPRGWRCVGYRDGGVSSIRVGWGIDGSGQGGRATGVVSLSSSSSRSAVCS